MGATANLLAVPFLPHPCGRNPDQVFWLVRSQGYHQVPTLLGKPAVAPDMSTSRR